jgi:hypothetical protein
VEEREQLEPGETTLENLLAVSGSLFGIRSSVIMMRYGTKE